MDKLVFTKDKILVKVDAKDWEESVRIAGGILEKAGSISLAYIDSMINAVKEMGPYMAILPNFALAHAAPSSDVYDNDFSMITLKKPVLFGSPNDPIYVIIAFCSKDGKSQIESLSNIAEMLMQEKMIDRLKMATNVEEIIEIMEQESSS